MDTDRTTIAARRLACQYDRTARRLRRLAGPISPRIGWATELQADLLNRADACDGVAEVLRTVGTPVTAGRYADHLAQLIRDAIAQGDLPGTVRTWDDIDAVIDANELLIETDRALGVPSPFDGDGPVDDDALQAYSTLVCEAITLATATLG